MVHQIRIALLALPSACMEMNNPQSTLPGQRWDMQSINHLMDSTTKLIQHSVTTKITPTIERFANATIEKIDSDVIPALDEEHEVTVDLLDQEYSRFQDILSNISSMRSEIASKDEECSRWTVEHEHCRKEEHTVVTEVKECKDIEDDCTKDWELCEETITIVEGDIEGLWCEESFDSLSKDFYHNSKQLMQKYIERKRKCADLRNNCQQHAPLCETKLENRTETRERCDKEQVHLEQCTCERANMVEHVTEDFTLQWNELTSAYEDLIKESEDLESQKIKEFEGLHVVKCLLEKIVVIGQTDGPCNESHVEQVTQEVAECHITTHLNTTHFVLNPKPSPVFPPLYEHSPYPCGPDFIALYYSHLPEDAGAKECDSHYCSTRLVQHPVVGR